MFRAFIRCLLLAIPLLGCATDRTTIDDDLCADIQGLKASVERGTSFFRASVYDSLARIRDAPRPIQVDLYILAHYLMYQESLGIEPDPVKTAALRQEIASYFLDPDRMSVWLSEGCIASKVLIGLRQVEDLQRSQVDTLAETYSQFILDHGGERRRGVLLSRC